MNEQQQKKHDEYFQELKSLHPEALAQELAMFLVLAPFTSADLTRQVIDHAKENTRILRHNARVKTHNNKVDRIRKLGSKKRLSKAEQLEMMKLAKDLGFKG